MNTTPPKLPVAGMRLLAAVTVGFWSAVALLVWWKW